MTDNKALILSKAESASLSLRVREELARKRMTRQSLADAAKLSISTLEKVLSGKRTFTLATIVRLEEGLGVKLLPSATLNGHAPEANGTAPDALGNYNRASVNWLEGSYLTIRPSFGERSAVYAYRTDIQWHEATSTLQFREAERVDQDYTQFGSVAVPHQSGHVYLVTNRHGQHRMIVLSRPTIKGELHGLLTTLQSGRGSHLSPIAAPIVLKLLKPTEKVAFGRITRSNAAHPAYRTLLQKTLNDHFAAFVTP